MNNEMSTGLFYHDTATDPEKFMGLHPRFSALGTKGVNAGGQIIDAGGTGSDNTSVWFVVWGDQTNHMLYPKGTRAGLQREDKGKTTKTNSDGSMLDVHREKFTWDIGFSVRDWRYISRIANIDVSDLRAGTVDIFAFMRQAFYRLKQRTITGGRVSIYCNAEVLEALDAGTTGDARVFLKPMEVEGKQVLAYRGIPLRECEAILNTEARIV